MILSTESGITYEVRQTPLGSNEIRQTPDFFGIGPLSSEETFLPATFIELPAIGKPCTYSLGTDNEGTEHTVTTDPIIHIAF